MPHSQDSDLEVSEYLKWVHEDEESTRVEILDRLFAGPVERDELLEGIANVEDITRDSIKRNIRKAVQEEGLVDEDWDSGQRYHKLTQTGRLVGRYLRYGKEVAPKNHKFLSLYPEEASINLPDGVLAEGRVTVSELGGPNPTERLETRLNKADQTKACIPVITDRLDVVFRYAGNDELITSEEADESMGYKTDKGEKILAGTAPEHVHTLPFADLPGFGLVFDSGGVTLLVYSQEGKIGPLKHAGLFEFNTQMNTFDMIERNGGGDEDGPVNRSNPRDRFITDCAAFYADLRTQAAPTDGND